MQNADFLPEPLKLSRRENAETESFKMSFKELYKIMKTEDFGILLTALVLGYAEIEFQCVYKELLLSVVQCFAQIRPLKEETSCIYSNETWLSRLNTGQDINNKINVGIKASGSSIEIAIIDLSKQCKSPKTYQMTQKIMKTLENNRMLDAVCEEYIYVMKTKYLSLAKVFVQINPSNEKHSDSNSKLKTRKNDSACLMNDLLISNNLPLTEMDIILHWADRLSMCKPI